MEAEQTAKVSAAPDWLLDTAALAPLHSLILSLSFLPREGEVMGRITS